MNRKTYGAHCSGWQHSTDERRHMIENLTLLAVMTVTVCGFLVLAFQPYAGPWSILGGLAAACAHLTFATSYASSHNASGRGSFYSLLSSLAGGAKRTVAVVVKRSDVMDFTITPGFDSRLALRKI
jgi:hypothetical protein